MVTDISQHHSVPRAGFGTTRSLFRLPAYAVPAGLGLFPSRFAQHAKERRRLRSDFSTTFTGLLGVCQGSPNKYLPGRGFEFTRRSCTLHDQFTFVREKKKRAVGTGQSRCRPCGDTQHFPNTYGKVPDTSALVWLWSAASVPQNNARAPSDVAPEFFLF